MVLMTKYIMIIIQDKMEIKQNEIRRKNPINRNNLFYSEEDFQFEKEIAKDYLEQDLNTTVILFEVDLENTNVDDLYHEAIKDGIRYKPPVEIHVRFLMNESELKTYDKQKNLGTYLQTGNLSFGVMEDTLKEMDCDIKRGDYIGVQVTNEKMEFFEVVNDGKINYNNKMTAFGYKPFYREISCSVVDTNQFRGL